MSGVTFTCPDCGHPLTSHNNPVIKGIHDFEGTVCTRCGRIINKNDIAEQARDYAEKLVRSMFGKPH
ncbi:ECs_2282 family putative zinc-binding protein [Salmonella enterica]